MTERGVMCAQCRWPVDQCMCPSRVVLKRERELRDAMNQHQMLRERVEALEREFIPQRKVTGADLWRWMSSVQWSAFCQQWIVLAWCMLVGDPRDPATAMGHGR